MDKKQFPDQLVVTPLPVSGDWQLCQPFSYVTPDMHLITVPKGFITDFASVPRLLRTIYESSGGYSHASVIHDYLYVGGAVSGKKDITRKDADQIFYDAMRASGVPKRRAYLLWAAVRAGGFRAWQKRK